jgi:hypothetical protein
MAKLGSYSYPDIRFGDAVELAARILTKFKGTVSVKGLAWELGMAEGSGTLFAKVAALRDFGLIEGRGELRVSPLAQRILHPVAVEEGRQARAEAFQRVELLRLLYHRFEGERPDDLSLLVGLEEVTKAPRDEIVRRATLIQRHLADAVRVLGRPVTEDKNSEYSAKTKNIVAGPSTPPAHPAPPALPALAGEGQRLMVLAGERQFSAPLTLEDIDIAMGLLSTIRSELARRERPLGGAVALATADEDTLGAALVPGAATVDETPDGGLQAEGVALAMLPVTAHEA